MWNRKNGISLIVLVISIILIFILTSTIIITTTNRTNDATLMAFENDMLQIKDNILVYYSINNMYPVISSESYTKNDINTATNLLYNNKYQGNFLKQANLSNDETFYKVDITKLDVISTDRGSGLKGELDYYLIALPSANLYYMMGEMINGEIVYSLNYIQGSSGNNVEVKENSTTSLIYSSDGINVTYNKFVTNKLGIFIDVNIAEAEELYILFQEQYSNENNNLKKIDIIKQGNNMLKMDDVDKIYSVIDDKSMNTDFVYDNTKPKKMFIIKKKGEEVVAINNIDLSNYNNEKPYIENNSKKIIIGENENKILFRVNNTKNNIKEVKYEYLKKYDVNSSYTINYYNNIDSFDENYLITNGRKGTMSSDGFIEITLPKDISDILVIVIDSAGNSSDIYNYNIYEDVPYINATITEYIFPKISFDIYINSTSYISTVTAQISGDGITYSDIQNLDIDINGNISKANISFDKLDNADIVFLKLIVNNSVVRVLKYKI